MLSAKPIFLVAAVIASALTLAGCNGGGISPAPATNGPASSNARTIASPDAAKSYAYTCQNVGTVDCLVYKGTKLYKTIKSGVKSPTGVAAGKDGTFYVADQSANAILVFSAGGKSLKKTLGNGGNAPVDVAVSGGALAVANTHSMTFFSAGATKPTRTLKDSDQSMGIGAAFDLKGNCYWSLATKKSGMQVDEFKGCKGKRRRLKLGSGSPYGLAFDGSGNLWYASYLSSANGVYKCQGVSSCALVWSNFVNPQYVNFSSDFSSIWVSDTGNYQYGAALYQIDVANGKTLKKITNGISFFDPPTGVAAGPGPL
jgi:streptogramin lyase